MDRAAEMHMFVRAVDKGSFSAAARDLDLTPSAVSKQIRRLEDRLGVRLFNRTTRRVSLTEAGHAYYERCARILQEIEEAEEAVTALNENPRGTLRVAATVAFGRVEVLPRINEFLERYPELNVEFELTDRHVDLIEEGIDVAIQWREQMEDPSLIARRLCVNRRIICAAPSYIERHGKPASPEELLEHNCLTLYEVSQFNDWAFEDAEHGYRVLHVGGNFRANTADALYEAALSGAGLARLSTWLVMPAIRAGRLVPVLPQYPHESSAYFVLYPHRRHLSRKVRAFVDFLVEVFTPIPPWEREGIEFSEAEWEERIRQG
ncbi:LysR family transcriptional regulator [Spiribacter halobius]|uniref:LysR family transcriptional regulator n=1 Tax=Sediminicurvatus halobius TaxID=2182432 RepID=A0A2U2N014_9GAMM|nr:LysR family transcriptional regulator [Spiribacter halobius]PWG62591.1 LysR family transcriptional regulator [Spiribacter halobius]UEX78491.1 LysR family transcriptional regulator [Spiribacter halobius]